MTVSRTKLIGRVVKEPSIVIGRPIACKVVIEVPCGTGTSEVYEVIVFHGRKPWRVEVGAKVCAIGVLRGHELWADYFREYPPPGRSR